MTNSPFVYSDSLYAYIKWGVSIVLPALATLYFALGNIWPLPYVEQVVATITAIATFLGITMGLSSRNYNKDETPVEDREDGVINIVDKPEGGSLFDLVLNQNPEDLKNMSRVVFTVNKK